MGIGIEDYEEETVIDALEIRDTSNHISSAIDLRLYPTKTMIIENDLNVAVTVDIAGSRNADGSKYFIVAQDINVNAGKSKYLASKDYIPYMFVRLSCSTSPSSGDITVVMAKLRST